MNPVSLAMDGLLAVLLLAAAGVGLRVNARLKLLRDGQGQFVKAVGDLDLAAARAEAGLAALRSATEEAHDALLTRIETARGLLPRLDRAAEDAATASARLEEGVRAADAAGRNARTAAQDAARAGERAAERAVEAVADRRRPPQEDDEVLTLRDGRPAAEPIPFPGLRVEAPDRGLAAALAVAGRIVEAVEPSAPAAPTPVADEPRRRPAAISTPAVSAPPSDGGKLARFVARRQGGRA